QRGCRGFKSHLPLHFFAYRAGGLRSKRVGCVVAAQAIPAGCDEGPPSMSTGEDLETPATADETPAAAEPAAEAKTRLDLDVKISDVGPCKKHLKVTIPRSD